MLVDGVTVEYRRAGRLDRRRPGAAASTSTTRTTTTGWRSTSSRSSRASTTAGPDIVLFVNGLPLAVIELKNAGRRERHDLDGLPPAPDLQGADPVAVRLQRRCWSSPTALEARDRHAHRRPGVVQALADDRRATTSRRRRMPRAARCCSRASSSSAASSTWCATSSSSRTTAAGSVAKKMAATTSSTRSTSRGGDAAGSGCDRSDVGRTRPAAAGRRAGDRRIGVVWHTQGSGKSLTMAFYAGPRRSCEPAMENPTIVVLTDRNDLDDQLFGTFAALPRAAAPDAGAGREPRRPARAAAASPRAASSSRRSRSSCPRRRATRHPVLSDRRNIVVIADEAHRSQYDFIDGFARHMRDALPERLVHRLHRHADRADRREHPRRLRRLHQRLRHPAGRRGRRHRADLLREPPRQARRSTRPSGRKIDPEFEEVTEGEEVERKEKLKTQVGAAGGDRRHREAARARSPRTSSSTSSSASRRWTARRWSSA